MSTAEWQARLDVAVTLCDHFTRGVVVDEVPSTQDVGRGCEPGTVVLARRQMAGRGQRGRAWVDSDDGLAVSVVVPARMDITLSLAAAVGVAAAIEGLTRMPAGLKWPNDVILDRRKAAGILIEQSDGIAVIGIGINVAQRSFPQPLDGRAVSLRQVGCEVDRLTVLEAVLPALDRTLADDRGSLARAWTDRNILTGRQVSAEHAEGVVHGEVIAVDPAAGVTIRTGIGESKTVGWSALLEDDPA